MGDTRAENAINAVRIGLGGYVIAGALYFVVLAEQAMILDRDDCVADSTGEKWHIAQLVIASIAAGGPLIGAIVYAIWACCTRSDRFSQWGEMDLLFGPFIIGYVFHFLAFFALLIIKAAAPILDDCPGVMRRFTYTVIIVGGMTLLFYVIYAVPVCLQWARQRERQQYNKLNNQDEFVYEGPAVAQPGFGGNAVPFTPQSTRSGGTSMPASMVGMRR